MSIWAKLVSEFQTIQRRPFELADPSILVPTNAQPLVEGEFLELNDAYKMLRGAADPAVVPSFCYFAERGRYETQAIQKGPFLYMGAYEMDTKIMDASSILVGSALEVATVNIGGIDRRALQLATSGFVVGYATRLPANNNGFLRFIRSNP